MIVLSKIAETAYKNGLKEGNFNSDSSVLAMYNSISKAWRKGFAAKYYPALGSGFTFKELAAAEVIIAALVYLHFIKCRNIEKLILFALKKGDEKGDLKKMN